MTHHELVGVVIVLAAVCSAQQNFGAERDRDLGSIYGIVDDLLSKSNAAERPPAGNRRFSMVYVHLGAHIVSVERSFDSASAKVTMFLRQTWTDDRLKFQVESVTLPKSASVWRPNTYLAVGHVTEEEASRTLTTVDEEGRVLYSQMLTVETPCTVNIANGGALCTVQFGSYQYGIEDVVYFWNRGEAVTNSPDARVRHVVTGNCSGDYDSLGDYSCASMTVNVSDGCWYVLFRYGIPSVLLVLVSYLHFWLPTAWTVARPLSALLPFHVLAYVMLAGLVDLTQCATLVWFGLCLGATVCSAVDYFFIAGVHAGRHSPESQPLHDIGSHKSNMFDVSARLFFPIVFVVLVVVYLIVFGILLA